MATTTTTTPARRQAALETPLRVRGRVRLPWDGPVRRRVAAAFASGLLLALAYPPFDLGPLALVALTPLLWSWRDATPRWAALYGFWFGVAFFGTLLAWVWYFGVVAYFPIVLAGGGYIAAPGAIIAGFGRFRLRSPWITAAVWVLFEQLRGRFPFGGLPWGETGAALHDLPVARSLAGWGGVAFVSFLVVAVNGFLVDVVVQARTRGGHAVAAATAGLTLVVAVSAVGHIARYEPTAAGTMRFALLQGNDQNRDIEDPVEFERVVVENHFELASRLRGNFDLIVFPESALNRNPEVDLSLRQRITSIAARHDSAVLVNTLMPAPEDRDYNTNLLYEPDGDLQGRYAKQHLVPFGEYVPFRDQLSFLDELDQIPYDYEEGPGRHVFEVNGHRFGTVICFESAFGPLVRDFVRDGAELMVVTTNNRSYRRSGNAAQHLALSQMRAAETGRPFLHASISGITGVIDPDGDVHDTTELFVNSTVIGEVRATSGRSPYVRFGDWAIWGCALGLVTAAVYGRLRARAVPSGGGVSSYTHRI